MTAPPVSLLDPDEARKAASFVKAIADVEARFALVLDLPADGVPLLGLSSPFALARESNSHALSLALEARQ